MQIFIKDCFILCIVVIKKPLGKLYWQRIYVKIMMSMAKVYVIALFATRSFLKKSECIQSIPLYILHYTPLYSNKLNCSLIITKINV